VRDLLREVRDRYRINFAAAAVDAPAERLDVAALVCADSGPRERLNEIWDDNEMDIESKELISLALKFGDAYLIALPDPDQESGISAYVQDPRNVRIFYDPERPRHKTHAIHTVMLPGKDIKERFLQVTYYDEDTVTQYITREPLTTATSGFMMPTFFTPDYNSLDFVQVDQYDTPVPGTVPVFHFRTSRPYGKSLITPAMGAQDAIYKLIVTMLTTVDYASFPQRYALTDRPDVGGDNFTTPSNEDDSTGFEDAEFEAGPGSTWLLSGLNLRVGQFAVADSANFLKPIDALVGYLARVTNVPNHYFTSSATPLSGSAYRNAERPLTKMCSDLQARFTVTFKEFFKYCLAIDGLKATTDLSWELMQAAEQDDWTMALIKKQLDVPWPVIMVECGYSQATVDKWREDDPEIGKSAPPQQVQDPNMAINYPTQGQQDSIKTQAQQEALGNKKQPGQ
jgi:hypothetical protein